MQLDRYLYWNQNPTPDKPVIEREDVARLDAELMSLGLRMDREELSSK